MSNIIFSEKKKKKIYIYIYIYIKMSSAAVVISALRVKLPILKCHEIAEFI